MSFAELLQVPHMSAISITFWGGFTNILFQIPNQKKWWQTQHISCCQWYDFSTVSKRLYNPKIYIPCYVTRKDNYGSPVVQKTTGFSQHDQPLMGPFPTFGHQMRRKNGCCLRKKARDGSKDFNGKFNSPVHCFGRAQSNWDFPRMFHDFPYSIANLPWIHGCQIVHEWLTTKCLN